MTEGMIDYSNYKNTYSNNLTNIKSIVICMGLYANDYRGQLYSNLTTINGLKNQIKKSNKIQYIKEIYINNCISWEIVTKDLNDNEIEYIKGL